MEYVNIMEAARRCQVSDKTIRRWIHAHKLPARFPQSNRSEIAVSDLEPFLPRQPPGHVQPAAIERRIEESRLTAPATLLLVYQEVFSPGQAEQISGTDVVHHLCKKEKKPCHSILASSRFWNKQGS
jgi:excisionase family DNA binding protein